MDRSKSDELNIESCKQFTRTLFGLQQTPFYMLQYKYAEKTASLARNMYESRNDIEYIGAVSRAYRDKTADTIEAAGLLANTAQYGWTNYDDIVEVANTEVAEYLRYVNIDKNEPLFRSTSNLLNQLGVCNTIKMYGPIFIVLARAMIIADAVGDKPNVSMLGKNSASYSAQLWSAYHTIHELDKANVQLWSPYVEQLFEQVKPILKDWSQRALISSINFKGSVSWHLDTSIYKPDKNCVKYEEL